MLAAHTDRSGATTAARLRLAFGALLLTLAVSACSSSSSGSGTASATPSISAAASASGSSAAASSTSAAAQISIKNFLFSPVTLTVQPGATVTVVNNDSTAHTLTASDKSFDTGAIDAGKSATFTAPTKPGSYPYSCSIHPFMHGTLTVS
ncbi:cupredoxin domain-containing protein [Kitasatospora sp. MAP5-34]|uniref:cupredoxin domain-containing protein n=1 Tax=Kitasatospora sp. MAP5-34 TaxID=3035102 RepID=UPI0024747263|nr:cupredoxin domain-containing protein [Kitasatospora sp. MAP5-34]MDH6577855.1 plastocyanin [Kitasatospora sp. MAP5-34]